MSDLTDRFLDHLWLQERLSANTLAAYRRDLNKIAVRLAGQGEDWLSADGSGLAAAVFRLVVRAVVVCRRLRIGFLLGSCGVQALPDPVLQGGFVGQHGGGDIDVAFVHRAVAHHRPAGGLG